MRVLIVDDHAIVREGLKRVLEEATEDLVVEEAADGDTALAKALAEPYDLILLDIGLPARGGLSVLADLQRRRPATPVLVLTIHPEEQYAVRALKAGASGYLNKGSAPEELVSAVRALLIGKRYITPALAGLITDSWIGANAEQPHDSLSSREFEVLRLIASGKSVKRIADDLQLSPKTVSTYRTRILEKMKLADNAELTRYAFQNGLVD